MSDTGSDPKIRISENFGSEELRSESDPKFSDIRTFRIGSPGSRIGYRIFGSDHRISGSGSLKFLKNPDPYPIRKPEIFSGYPIRNIRNLKIGSDIRNFGSDRRIFGSDIFAHPYIKVTSIQYICKINPIKKNNLILTLLFCFGYRMSNSTC